MSEEVQKMGLFSLFQQTAQTLDQAEAKAKSEKGFEKIDRFRTPEEGEYVVRVLPLAPTGVDSEGKPIMPMDRNGFEFQLYSTFLDIDQPADKKGKVKTLHIPVIKTTQKGVDKSVDLLEKYLEIAKDMYADDDEVIELLTGQNSRHRIRFSNQRVMYVLDLTDGTPKGPMFWQVSTSSYKDIDNERRSVWTKESEKAAKKGLPKPECPLCGLTQAWPLTITRTGTKFNDTKYAFKIDRGEEQLPLTEEQLQKLFDLPRIPDEIYHYTRYQMEATIEYLKQYDEKHDLEVCKDQEFLDAIEQLKGELSTDDNSHFSLSGDNTSGKDNSRKITLESLNEAYDYIVDKGLGKDSDEYEELREDIRQFIEDNELDVVVKHSKKIEDLLEEIEEALDSKSKTPTKPAAKEEPAEENDDDDDDKNEQEEEKPRTRKRPSRQEEDDEEQKPSKKEEDNDDDKDDNNAAEEQPRPRRRRRSEE